MGHLHDGTVLWFSKYVFKIRMVKSPTYWRIPPSYHRHNTFVLVLYTTWSFRPVCAIFCLSRWHHPHTIIKLWFSFSFFSSSQQPIWELYSHQKACTTTRLILLVQYTSTVNIAKSFASLQDHLCGLWTEKNASMTAFYLMNCYLEITRKMVTTRLFDDELAVLW